MNYNDFTYYRANPYARQGYIPPIAYSNRHKPQFFTEIPMGEQHLSKIGRRQYNGGVQKSSIQSQSILKSPERYPFQNRIALQKTYERNMNTIDIQGASSGTLMSQAVRNKFKARQQLVRRQNQKSLGSYQQLKSLENTEQQKRRKVAYQQYIRNQQIQQINSGRFQNNEKYFQSKSKNRNAGSQFSNGHYQSEERINRSRVRTPQKQSPSNKNYQNIYKNRYQSIQVLRPSYNPENQINHSMNKYQNNSYANQNDHESSHQQNMSDSQILNSNLGYNVQKQQNSVKLTSIDRKQLRQQNPTTLSSENSIYLAGKNIISS